jgi:glycosyltransferase involved in cell wall biosynthesis
MGQKPPSERPNILTASDIGLALLRPSEIFKAAVPRKIYEYMAVGLPVLTNVAGETTRIISESNFGIAIPEDNPHSLSQQIIKLQANPNRLNSMSVADTEYARNTTS